jgi:pyridoxine 4-dehydrogenase
VRDAALAGVARKSGSFTLAGTTPVTRLGFGAMRIAGEGVWGPPKDYGAAIATLKRLSDLGIGFIDTADSYGPEISERLIAEALHPYKDFFIATKGGLVRPGPNQWNPFGRPDYLRQQVFVSLRRLKVERIDLWQLHRIDPNVPRDEQFCAIAEMQKEGLIHHAGLSEVSIADITAAQKHFKVATVQNRYNLSNRQSEDVLKHCEAHGIGFIPWVPLAAGKLAETGSQLSNIPQKYGASPGQIALAWLLKRSPVMMPIPGTGNVLHLEQNAAAAAIALDDADFKTLSDAHV